MLMNFSMRHLSDRQAKIIKSVLEAALNAVDPRLAVQRFLSIQDTSFRVGEQVFDLRHLMRIRVVGVGKAAIAMAMGVIDILGGRLTDGLLITKHSFSGAYQLPPGFTVYQGGHPVPSQASVDSTKALVAFLAESKPEDLVLFLISGGGSALMTLPVEGVSLQDMQRLTNLLLSCGATINEMNTLRKHLDQVKGGGLLRLASPARVATLILSDVVGSPMDVIASGPTVADPSTFFQALQIIQKYRLSQLTPGPVMQILQRGARGELLETLKPYDPILMNSSVHVIGSNLMAAVAGLEQADKEGLRTLLLTTYLQGEASQAGAFLASLLRQIDATGQPVMRPACLVAGGETTVTIHGNGMGGRNQELALGAANILAGLDNVAITTLGTDGEDGPTDAAGAVVTGQTIDRALELGMDPQQMLQNNDSYTFFRALGDHVITGPTGTNVNDLVFLFAF